MADLRHIALARQVFLQRLLFAWSRLDFDPSIRVTSYVRTPAANRAARGAPDSQHLIGTAIDLAPSTFALQDALASADLVVIPERSHVHVQLWPSDLEPVRRLAPELVGWEPV